MVLVQKLDPLAFSNAVALAQRFSFIAKDDSHIESAIVRSDHGFVLVSQYIFPLLIHYVPDLHDTFGDKNDFVDFVQLIKN